MYLGNAACFPNELLKILFVHLGVFISFMSRFEGKQQEVLAVSCCHDCNAFEEISEK